jgi:hypothetical protein
MGWNPARAGAPNWPLGEREGETETGKRTRKEKKEEKIF